MWPSVTIVEEVTEAILNFLQRRWWIDGWIDRYIPVHMHTWIHACMYRYNVFTGLMGKSLQINELIAYSTQ